MNVGLGFLVGFAFLLMFAYQAPPLVRREQWGELAVFAGLWFIGLVPSVMLTVGLRLPSPTVLIEFLLEPVAKLLDKLLM